MPDGVRIGLLAALTLVAAGLFLTLGVSGNWDYVVARRARTLATMAVVAVAVAVATVLFHTVTANRILTPSIMGFDALYLLVQTTGVFVLGAGAGNALGPIATFALDAGVMVGLALLLYRWLLADGRHSLHLLVLVGVVIGIGLRSASALLQRMMAPELFVVLQDRFFADFNSTEPHLLATCAAIVTGVVVVAWWQRRLLDVTALGRSTAIGLGVDHRRVTWWVLVAIAVLVAVATALVGPTTFFGLLVAHLAYRLLRAGRHAYTLPAAALCAVTVLVGGQLVFERVLGFEGSLSMVVEFLGGIVFIVLLLRKA